jgi:NADPH-dependent 2,4-dienoyl-CoA reductase/sulfur reductase-like enzyme
MKIDILIIGGGAGGISSALKAYHPQLKVLIVERENTLGGILNQCIHNGFGIHHFKEELTGPEYARKIENFLTKDIQVLTNTSVLNITKTSEGFAIDTISEANGMVTIEAKAVIMASGAYERTKGQIRLPGRRFKGIMTAGSAQRYLNIDGYLVGKKVFILGSGDIGLIMARRMTLEGASVLGVAELMPYSNGLNRNIAQCLEDFDIPLYLSHTVSKTYGTTKLEGLDISEVDSQGNILPGTEKHFDVDTLLLSVGLIPEITITNKLPLKIDNLTRSASVNQNYMSNIDGLFFAGNALHIHDLVDYVSLEGEHAGEKARVYVMTNKEVVRNEQPIIKSDLIRYSVPQVVDFNNLTDNFEIAFRSKIKATMAVFRVKQDGIVIREKRARYVVPAEMEKMVVELQDLVSTSPLELEMEVLG